MDGYVRVSRVGGRTGESFISPDMQREQIEGWAKLRSVTIAAWHEDLDQSGGKLDRPGLTAMLARIEAGETDGVVVAKLDRLSRLGVADALKLVERITDAGGVITALDLGLDPTTPFGEFGMVIMLGLGRMERRRLSESWEDAKTRALDRGARMGPTPFGYLRDDNGTLVSHPEHGKIVTEAFKRAARDGVPAALDYLRAKAPDDRAWTAFTVRRMLRNRSYLGETRYGDRLERDSHPALVSRLIFERAHPGEDKPQRRAAAVFPLSGFATCAGCGETVVGSRAGIDRDGNGRRAYRCRASMANWKGERCPAPVNVLADRLEDYLIEHIKTAYEQDGTPVVAEGTDDKDGSLEDAQSELDAAENELERFAADPTAAELLGEAAWAAALRVRAERAEGARLAYRERADQAREANVVIPPIELLDTLAPEELTIVLQGAFQSIRVTKGRGPMNDRVELAFHGEALAGIPAL